MSTTKVLTPLRVTAPAELLDDDSAALDFLAGEFLFARMNGADALDIVAATELLPTLALAAGAFDAAEMPANFRLVDEAQLVE
ncbi:hypothetical protein [Corynebacterium nasicanis]|uniref:Uncharacterized protein n=1 Tax=Corynebacterium nasicanis TaxID=1448267 RepID=A0ABW1QFR2_9CORY